MHFGLKENMVIHMIGYCYWWTLWLRVVCVWMMCLSGYACRLLHTAPESVKRVKSSAQILDKSFFWSLSAINAFGGSSRHQRTPLLNACQKWSPLMTGATSKCICGVQPPEKWLIQNLCATFYSFNTFRSGVGGGNVDGGDNDDNDSGNVDGGGNGDDGGNSWLQIWKLRSHCSGHLKSSAQK